MEKPPLAGGVRCARTSVLVGEYVLVSYAAGQKGDKGVARVVGAALSATEKGKKVNTKRVPTGLHPPRS